MNTESNASIGGRLLKERDRLKMKQEEFAKRIGITRQTQAKYEKGKRMPDAKYLAAISLIGADVQYILTGIPGYRKELTSVLRTAHEREYIDAKNVKKATESNAKSASDAHINAYPQRLFTENEQSVAQERAEYGKPVLSPREAALLDNYRHCTDEGDKNAIERMALLAARAGKFKEKKSGND